MTANGNGAQTITGVVRAVNDKGIRLNSRDGWLNYSKWAGDLTPPPRGAGVVATLDRQGFIRHLEVAQNLPTSEGSPGAGNGRETAIIRQTCLKAAAEFAASRPEIKSADVLTIAERWEAWVRREQA